MGLGDSRAARRRYAMGRRGGCAIRLFLQRRRLRMGFSRERAQLPRKAELSAQLSLARVLGLGVGAGGSGNLGCTQDRSLTGAIEIRSRGKTKTTAFWALT